MLRTDRTLTIASAAALAAALAAAAPAAADPTLELDRPCYSPGDVMQVTGSGWTPTGGIDLSFTGDTIGLEKLVADTAGQLRATYDVTQRDVDEYIGPDAMNGQVLLGAVDTAAAEANDGRPAGAALRFTLSQFGAAATQDWQAIRARRRMAIQVAGFTGHAGRRLHLHYVRAGRRTASIPFGLLRGDCGDTQRTLQRAFPAKAGARPGRWTMVFNLSATDHRRFPRLALPVRVAR